MILSSAVGIEDERRKGLWLRRLKVKPNEKLVHPLGEGDLDFKFLPAGGQFHLRGSDEALTAYGGLVAWDHFLQHCGV
jgi:hypothetical protein